MRDKLLYTASTCSHILHFHLPYLAYFQERGWEVHVACGSPIQPIPYADEVLELPFRKSMKSPQNFKAASLLREKMEKERYKLVSTHTALAAFFTRLALTGLRNRPFVVNTVHGYLFDDQTPLLKRELLLTAERWTAPQTDLLLTMNQWDYETAVRYRLGREVAPVPGVGVDFSKLDGPPAPGRDLRSELGISDDAFLLLYAAEFSKRKNQEVLIRAMEKLPERVVLVLAGDGALRKDCQKLAYSLNLGHRVFVPGYAENMPDWYRASDAVVSASRSEGLPFHIMEAMYMGLPVVVSRVKGHTDLVRDDVTGLLYPYGDSAACAEQIMRLAQSPELPKQLGEQARQEVKQYALERVKPLTREMYESVLERKAAVGSI